MTPKQIPPDIEQMLNDGAERHGISVEEYREKIANDIHDVAAKRRKYYPMESDKQLRYLLVTYQKVEEEAARMGCQVAQLLESYLRIMDDDEAPGTHKPH